MLCAFGFSLLLRAEVPVFAFVVCGEGGSPMSASQDDVTNYVGKLNFVFSQVGIDFQLAHYSVITNDAWLSIVGSNESQYEALCATTNSTGGIEMYFVLAISGGDIYGLGRKRKRNKATGSLEDVWDLFNVEVGFWVHGTRTPRCE